MEIVIRKAEEADADIVWDLISSGIKALKEKGSNQWQSGFPNKGQVDQDIKKRQSYVAEINGEIFGTFAIIPGPDPRFANFKGKWLNPTDSYVTLTRGSLKKEFREKRYGLGLGMKIDSFFNTFGVKSARIFTSPAHLPMMRITKAVGYTQCGEIQLLGEKLVVFEKLTVSPSL